MGGSLTTPKLRISLTEKGGEIKGKIESEGPLYFTLESLALSIEKLAPDPVDFARDLYLFIKKEAQQ